MLAPELPPVWGGVGTYVFELIRSLPEDIGIHVVTPFREGFGTEDVTTHSSDLSKYFGENIHLHFVCRANDTFTYNARFQYACFKYLPKLLKREEIDLIHSHTAHMPDLLLRLKRNSVPTITTVHTTIQGQREGTKESGMNFSSWEFSEKMTLLSYPFLKLAESIYFSRGRYYITPSKLMKKYLVGRSSNFIRKNIFIIPHGVDTNLFSPSERKKCFDMNVILFVGRLIALKGIHHLIRSMPLILRKHPKTLFIFIGTGNIHGCINELGYLKVSEKNYKFLGYKDRNMLPKYYNEADLYVLPSLQENFPFTLLEAMACGVPSIVSDVGGVSEIVDNKVNGIMVRPGSVKQIADAVIYLLDNPIVRERLGRKARETIEEKFSLDTMGFKTSLVYSHIINSR